MADLTVVRIVKPAHKKFFHWWVLAEVRPAFGEHFEKLILFKTQSEAERVGPGYSFKG
jgi:hypothetical protein